ncbi:hypothetical protein MIMGU_mgv11b0234052mg, partial [Erythranthe guttata]
MSTFKIRTRTWSKLDSNSDHEIPATVRGHECASRN